MNSQRRMQHVNKCIDRQEASEQAEKEGKQLLEQAQTAILDCPMCGRACKTQQSRKSHLKRCSVSLGVSTEQMLKLVRDQETERENLLAAGVMPANIRSKISKAAGPKKKAIKEPKSQFEEDVQVAMAISTSLSDPQTVEAPRRGRGGKGKGKKSKDDMYLLLTASEEYRQSRIQQKVSGILTLQPFPMENQNTKYLNPSNLHHPRVGPDDCLWERDNISSPHQSENQFYVAAIMPPITARSGCGGRIPRHISIPGREASFVTKDTQMTAEISQEESMTASTQTAVILAELAGDFTQNDASLGGGDTRVVGTPVGHISLSEGGKDGLEDVGCCDLSQASGFCMENMGLKEEDQRDLQRHVCSDIGRLFNNKEFSDVRLTSSEGLTVHAHRAILGARCRPLILKEENSVINLKVSSGVLVSLLKFLYSGEVTIAPHLKEELEDISVELNLPQLTEACKGLVLQTETSGNDVDLRNVEEENVGGNLGTGISNIDLKAIWGESESDEDDDNETVENGLVVKSHINKDTSGQSSVESESDFDREDYRDIVCTQFKKVVRMAKECDATREDDTDDVETDFPKETSQSEDDRMSERCTESVGENHDEIAIGYNSSMGSAEDEPEVASKAENKETHAQGDSVGCKRKSDEQYDGAKRMKIDTCINENRDCDSPVSKEVGTPLIMNESCNRSSVDLFCSPTPKKSSVSPQKNGYSWCARSTIASGNDDTHSSLHFSTPVDDGPNFPKWKSRISTIPTDISPQSNYDDRNMENLNTTIDELMVGKNDEMVSKSSEKKSNAMDVDNKSDSGTSDDIEITGDNFDDLEESSQQVSPRFNSRVSQLNSNSEHRNSDSLRNHLKNEGLKTTSLTDESSPNGKNPFSKDSRVGSKGGSQNSTRKVHDLSDSYMDTEDCEDESNKSFESQNSDIRLLTTDKHSIEVGADEVQDVAEVGEVLTTNNHSSEEDVDEIHDVAEVGEDMFQDEVANIDVWDDFDDCGAGYEPPASPLPSCSQAMSNNLDLQTETVDLTGVEESDTEALLDGDDSFVFKIDNEVGREEKAANSDPANVENKKMSPFKTPSTNQIADKRRGKDWVPPSPFTPMPQYDTMATPVLKKAVQKYGVKPVGKKRMIGLLVDIYQKTHQYETDSECEDVEEATDDSKPGQIVSEDEELSSSQLSQCSQDSDSSTRELLEESCLVRMSSDSETETVASKSAEVGKKLLDFILSKKALHQRVLMYEPLELDILKQEVKDAGIRCSMDSLMAFLDERCIAFTSKNTRKRAPAKGGRGRKAVKKPAKQSSV
ncbi:structure-specific endonuclease subunit SLX4-like isoform X2 [Mya arenaria]|nr:structure-specific endonuclease subunit SLX4-like isoform X2 [Mya arenaria]